MKGRVFYHFKKANSPCFVFLHGFGGDSSVWQFMEKPILKKGFSFLSIDLRGHGLSAEVKKPLAMNIFAEDIKKIIDKKKIKKIILIGHCFGGMVGIEFALGFSRNIQGLVLICSNSKLPFGHQIAIPPLSLLKNLKLKRKTKHVDFNKFKGTGNLSLKRVWSDIINTGPVSYANIYRGTHNWNREKQLKKINLPVLIIGGKKDIIFPPASQKKLACVLRQSKLVFLDTNHIAPVNDPQGIKKAIFNWLAGSLQL